MNDYFSWRDDWLLDIELLDRQHMAIAACLSTLANHYRIGQDSGNTAAWKQELEDLLERLRVETSRHFHDEEQLMHETQYLHLKHHRYEHVMLLAELKQLISNINTGKEELDTDELSHLKTWLIAHTIDSDRKFADYYHSTRSGRQAHTGNECLSPADAPQRL
ncbi:MAG: hemerythrin family protein [Pseudomonadota bacterium]